MAALPHIRNVLPHRLYRLLENFVCTKTSNWRFDLPPPTTTLTDIKTETFNKLIADLRVEGWVKALEYDNIDAWIDYGMIILRRDKQRLKCTWTNWEEGTIEGSPELVDELRPLLKQPPRA
jgi:hypothetical protein